MNVFTCIFDSMCAAVLDVFKVLWQQSELEVWQLEDRDIYCIMIMQPCVDACGQCAE